jgi:RNA polymerase sigma factor (sigma-70 family)
VGPVRLSRRPADSQWERLYREERPALVRTAMLVTGSPEMAEDAFHTAIERIRPRLGEIDRPGAYLRIVVVNVARDLAKQARREQAGDLPMVLAAGLDTRQIEIWSALGTLTERRRTALVLRYYADLAVGEIAELLDCKPSSASSLLHRGLADLRKELSDDET